MCPALGSKTSNVPSTRTAVGTPRAYGTSSRTPHAVRVTRSASFGMGGGEERWGVGEPGCGSGLGHTLEQGVRWVGGWVGGGALTTMVHGCSKGTWHLAFPAVHSGTSHARTCERCGHAVGVVNFTCTQFLSWGVCKVEHMLEYYISLAEMCLGSSMFPQKQALRST